MNVPKGEEQLGPFHETTGVLPIKGTETENWFPIVIVISTIKKPSIDRHFGELVFVVCQNIVELKFFDNIGFRGGEPRQALRASPGSSAISLAHQRVAVEEEER